MVPVEDVTGWIKPGSRGLIRERRRHKEILFLWPVDGSEWIVYDPDGQMTVDTPTAMPELVQMTGVDDYPTGVLEVLAFDVPLEREEMLNFVKQGRLEALDHRRIRGITYDEDQGLVGVDWDGAPMGVPVPGPLAVFRRRVLHKRAMPTERVPGIGTLPLRGDVGGLDQPVEARGAVTPRFLAADVGKVFIVVDTELAAAQPSRFGFGTKVHPFSDSRRHGELLLGNLGDGIWGLCREVTETEIELHNNRAASLFVGTGGGPDLGELEVGSEDSRTLWIDREKHSQKRFKEFRTAVDESYQEPHVDTNLIGKPNSLHVCKKMAKSHMRPSAWLLAMQAKKSLGDNDRNYHELSTLVKIVEEAGEVDQVNLGGLVCLETATRRISAIMDAIKNGAGNANWSQAQDIMGADRDDDLLAPERREEVSRGVKLRLEIENLRQRTLVPARSVTGEGVDDASSLGGLPSSAPAAAAPLSRKARAKTRAKAEAAAGDR